MGITFLKMLQPYPLTPIEPRFINSNLRYFWLTNAILFVQYLIILIKRHNLSSFYFRVGV